MKKLEEKAFNRWIFEIIDDYSHRLEVYCGGAGSGKSVGAMQKVILKALRMKRRVLVIRKVGRTLQDSVFALALELLSAAGVRERCRVRRSAGEIELPGGSALLFRGLDDPEKLKSIQSVTDIVCEEATELSFEDFTQLNLRLRPREPFPQIFLMFNPVSKASWVYKAFFDGGDAPPPLAEGALIIRTTYRDNAFLPSEYVSELERLREINPEFFSVYSLGEFSSGAGLVFPRFETALVGDGARGLPFCGLDFGFSHDPTAIVWGNYDEKGRIITVKGEYFRRGMHNGGIAEALRALGLAKERITADSSEPKSIAELRERCGIPRVEPAKKGADSVRAGIQFIGQHRLIVDERCVKLMTELQNYRWRKDARSGAYINEPEDAFNHGLDALRYGLERFSRAKRLRLIGKSYRGRV